MQREACARKDQKERSTINKKIHETESRVSKLFVGPGCVVRVATTSTKRWDVEVLWLMRVGIFCGRCVGCVSTGRWGLPGSLPDVQNGSRIINQVSSIPIMAV